jgi:hypothetical protein
MKFLKIIIMVVIFYMGLKEDYTSYADGLPFNGTWDIQNQEMTIDSLKVTGNIVWVFRSGNVYKFNKTDGTYKQYNIDEINNRELYPDLISSGYDVCDDGYVWLYISENIGMAVFHGLTHIKRCNGDSTSVIIEFDAAVFGGNLACDNENGIWLGGIAAMGEHGRVTRWNRTTYSQIINGGDYQKRILIAGSTAWLTFETFPYFIAMPESGWSGGFNFLLATPYNDKIPYTQGFSEIAGNNEGVTIFGKSSNGYGIVKFKEGIWTRYTTADGLISNNIYALAIDKHGNIWAAGNGGVSWFDGTTWATLTTANSGLLDNTITGIGVDSDGVVWFGSQQGLVTFEYNETPYVEESEPKIISLYQPYPNPFNASTTITFTLPSRGFTSLIIYNLMGQKIREFATESLSSGTHSVVWDGRDNSENVVSSGTYIARLKAVNYITSRTMTLIK